MRNRIHIVTILLVSILLPNICHAANAGVETYRKFMWICGYESPERSKALTTLGMSADQIDSYYNDIALTIKHYLEQEGAAFSPQMVASYPMDFPLISPFRRENCWTFAIAGDDNDFKEIYDFFKEIPFSDINFVLGNESGTILAIEVFKMEMEKGVEALYPKDLPTKSYIDKVRKLLKLTGEDEVFKMRMKSLLTQSGASIYCDKVDFYIEKGDFAHKMACVFQQYLTENQLDDLIYLYSTKEGQNISDYKLNISAPYFSKFGNSGKSLNKIFEEISNMECEQPTEQLIMDAWRLDSFQTMRDFQASWDIIELLSSALIRNDFEEDVLGLTPGTLTKFDNSVLERNIKFLENLKK